MTVTLTRVTDINVEVTCPYCGTKSEEMIWRLDLVEPAVDANCSECDEDFTFINPFAEIAGKLLGLGGQA